MRRRALLAGLGGMGLGALAPRVSLAQGRRALRRVGVLGSGGARAADQIRAGLKRLGWVEGANFEIVARVTDGGLAPLDAMAAELVALPVDAIVANATPAVEAAMRATKAIPIVMMASGDALGSGLVRNLARPEGNVTGLSLMLVELAGKLVELLAELTPGRGIACLVNPNDPLHAPFLAEAARAARQLSRVFTPVIVRDNDDLDASFAGLAAAGVGGVVVQPIFILSQQDAARVAAAALRHRLATASALRRFAAQGGTVAYAAEFDDLGYRAALYLDRIFAGALPGDLPIERPTIFELALNLKTAGAIGLQVPQHLVARADEVIE